MDANTQELSRYILEEIKKITGGNCFPHLIINKLRRTKLDANRDLYEAALGHPEASNAWFAFHRFIDTAKSQVQQQFGKGLLIDLHGHGHNIQRLELGYLLSGAQLRTGNNYLNSIAAIENSSIRHLVTNHWRKDNHAALLNGQESMGGFYEMERYPAVPGPADLAPRSGDDYFSGGYNTERHGSVDSGRIDAIQIECNFVGVRDNEISLRFFAEATANVLIKYLKTHYVGNDGRFCTTVTSAGIEKNEPLSIGLFPNPACQSVTVDLPKAGLVKIYDMAGRMLRAFDMLTQGVHTLPLSYEENWLSLQFIAHDGSHASMKLIRQCR
jgi:hypothetical protein